MNLKLPIAEEQTCSWCKTVDGNSDKYYELATWEYLNILSISDGICEECSNALLKPFLNEKTIND